MKQATAVLLALLIFLPCASVAQTSMGVALEAHTTDPILLTAGEGVEFVLSARNEKQELLENWNEVGHDAILVVQNSYAETDSNRNSWNAWADGYTWLRLKANGTPLTADSTSTLGEALLYFTIPKSSFALGKATLTFMQSRADSNILLTVTPQADSLRQQSPPIVVQPAEHADYLVDITSPFADSDDVYFMRKFEVVVAPRDRYTNVISGREIQSQVKARFRLEFDPNYPGVSYPFDDPIQLHGMERFFLISRVRHADEKREPRQWLRVSSVSDTNVTGRTSPFQVLDHAPYPAELRLPVDQSVIRLVRGTDLETFTWTKPSPADPYMDIQVSRFDPRRVSDVVRYGLHFIDAQSYTRKVEFEAANDGMDSSLTLNHAQLSTLMDEIAGPAGEQLSLGVLWYAVTRDFDNTDGMMFGPLYTTQSKPIPIFNGHFQGFRLSLIRNHRIVPVTICGVGTPEFRLHQNYPNPFNPSTTIALQLPNPGHCRLLVHNILGEEVAVLHDGFLDAGEHTFSFDGGGRSSGLYSYRLESGDIALTRWMTLLR
ncbi:MAG: hypothetical protein M5R41_14170 [Bacteroidia bacterium]|nr:hypothetical protein [Bacteroidia bacterium]